MTTEEWADWSCAVAVVTSEPGALAPSVEIVRTVMAEVAAAASRFRDDSDLVRVNNRPGRYVPVSPLLLTLVDLAISVAESTAGAVTPTVGAALAAAGYDDDIAVVRARPSTSEGEQDAPVPRAAEVVRVDRELCRVGVTDGTILDLGAVGKAWAVDESVRRLAARGIDGVLVSIGGDLAVHGTPPGGWRIAVSETPDSAAELVEIDAGALATSSTRGRRWAGGRHHVIDPRTGRSTRGRWRSATVWAPTVVEANVFSTWTLVSADEAEAALARAGRPSRLVADDGRIVPRAGWPTATSDAPQVVS
ncbi:FAD:protein FMN transferase [Microbacterium sp. X-17]|uniref:FAD:protein FMN transferase n=1 Tax=Microbacterium sp. X-17 TaxID=3144404 RepID=UPI0031F5D038